MILLSIFIFGLAGFLFCYLWGVFLINSDMPRLGNFAQAFAFIFLAYMVYLFAKELLF